jgi:hypothetical protein
MKVGDQLRKEQKSGFLPIAVVILLTDLLPANLHSVFPRGWWRVW